MVVLVSKSSLRYERERKLDNASNKASQCFPAKRIEIVIKTQEEVISYDNLLENLIISDMKYVMAI